MKIKKETLVLVFIIFLGLILRLWGINFGLPYLFHQDEPIVVNHAMAYGTGDFNPHFFAIPPLTSYILFIVYGLFFIVGKLFGVFTTADSFALSFLKDPTFFYLLGRFFIGVVPGTLCIFFTFRLYKHFFSSYKGALFAAAVVAFSFLNVLNSHYIYTDMLMSLFIIVCMIRIIIMYHKPTLANYLYAGLIIGMAASIKYNAIILIAPFIIVHFLVSVERKHKLLSRNLFIYIASLLTVFFATNPFAFLDFKFFISALSNQAGASVYVGWIHHIFYSLKESVTVFIGMCGLLGFIILFLRNMRRAFILLSFPLIFYIHLVFLSQHFPRYILPIIPFFALSSGYLIFEFIIPKIKNRMIAKTVVLLCVFSLVPLAVKSIKADYLLSIIDTRTEAASWIESNIEQDQPIAVDHTFFRPAITQNKRQLEDKHALLGIQDGLISVKKKKLELMLKAAEGKKGYHIYYLSKNPEGQGQFLSTMPALAFDYNLLRAKGIKYIVINYANRQKAVGGFYEELKNNAQVLKSFSPYKNHNIRFSYDLIATTCMPILSAELYSKDQNGPALVIYEVKDQ